MLLRGPEEEIAVVNRPIENKGLILHILYVEAFNPIELVIQSVVATLQFLIACYLLLQLYFDLLLFLFSCIQILVGCLKLFFEINCLKAYLLEQIFILNFELFHSVLNTFYV